MTSGGDAGVNNIEIGALSGLTIDSRSLFDVFNATGSSRNHGYIKVTGDSTLQLIQGTFDNSGQIYLGSGGMYNTLMINEQVVLDGGGTIAMGAHSNGGENLIVGEMNYPNSNIVLYNVNNDITGSGEIYGLNFDNETNGVVEIGSARLSFSAPNVAGQDLRTMAIINADDGGTLQLVAARGSQPFFNWATSM